MCAGEFRNITTDILSNDIFWGSIDHFDKKSSHGQILSRDGVVLRFPRAENALISAMTIVSIFSF